LPFTKFQVFLAPGPGWLTAHLVLGDKGTDAGQGIGTAVVAISASAAIGLGGAVQRVQVRVIRYNQVFPDH